MGSGMVNQCSDAWANADRDRSGALVYRNLSEIPSERTSIVRSIGRPEQAPEQPDTPHANTLRALQMQQRMERERQIKRYQTAGLSYVRSMLRGNLQAASEVWDQIVFKWLEGRLSTYDRSLSFRIYFKAVLRNAVRRYVQDRKRNTQLAAECLAPELDLEDPRHLSASEEFDNHLRSDLLRRALNRLQETDSRCHQILQLQIDAEIDGRQQLRSAQLAELIQTSEEHARTIRRRARHAYARAIIAETEELTGTSDVCRIRETLRDLGLLEYCRRALPGTEAGPAFQQ